MTNKYYIKIVPYDPVEHDLQRYPSIDKVGFTVGYLVYQNNLLTHTSWHKSYKSLYKALDKFLNITN